MVTKEDFTRSVMIGLSQDGSILSWMRGGPKPDGILPVFSVDTQEQFNEIRVRFGRKQYNEDRYVWSDFGETLEALHQAGEDMKAFYASPLRMA